MDDLISDTRPGEIRLALPQAADAHVHFIGRIRSPWTSRAACPKNTRDARALGDAGICTIEFNPRFGAGLQGISAYSHVWALYWMDRAPRDLIVQAPKHLNGTRGVFALRSPARPNPIAMAAAQVISVDGLSLRVLGLDCLDGTPLIDVKPYFASTDAVAEAAASAGD